MARKSRKKKKPIEQYDHRGKERTNNPPIGLVTAQTDKVAEIKTAYQYDPHLDPQLQWAGKAEHTSFEVPTVSLHVHERIDPITIIEAVRKENREKHQQLSLFTSPEENPPLREAIEFYKHKHNWSNRLIAGDSLLVMNSLIKKEGMGGQVQMIYIDPPYGIKFGSNFQPFVNKRNVKDGRDEDMTQEPEMIKAFRDTWELGIHSYLTYLSDRLLLARELLTESGSVFVQINDENVHHVKELMDEVLGMQNFCSIIVYQKTGFATTSILAPVCDYLLWYAKDSKKIKYRDLFREVSIRGKNVDLLFLEKENGEYRRLNNKEKENISSIPDNVRIFESRALTSQGKSDFDDTFEFNGTKYNPSGNQHWKTTLDGLRVLAKKDRLLEAKNSLRYKRYIDDFPYGYYTNIWQDTITGSFTAEKIFVVQTNTKVVERCMLMTSDPGDLVFDPTCGSGTTAFVAEQWGRRWITCDTSRVAITIAKQRIMVAIYDYYELAHPNEGVGSGFNYKTVPHITLKSLANNEPPAIETLYDQPLVDKLRIRISGPFTVEAVPSPTVKSLSEIEKDKPADDSISRSGETLRQAE